MKHVIFRVGDSIYSLPADSVRSIELKRNLVTADSRDPLFMGFMMVRGRAIPVFSSWTLFGKKEGEAKMVVVMDTEYGSIGLAVDEVEDVIDIDGGELNPQNISDMFAGTFSSSHGDTFVINTDSFIKRMGVS